MAEEPAKRPRGNPQFQLNKKNKNSATGPSQNQSPPMTEEEKPKDTTPEATEKTESTAQAPPAESKPTDKLPDDLFSDEIPRAETLPLDGEVKVKDYAALPDAGANAGATTPDGKPAASSVGAAEATGATPVAPLTPQEQQDQAKQSVDLMLKGYEKLHALGRWLGKVDVNELASLHANGDINLHQELPLGKKIITVGGFFEDFNASIDKNIIVTDDFKDNIRPPLTRIVIKNKLFLSDELYVAMIVSEDLTTKTSMLMGLKKSANMVLTALKESTKAQKDLASKKTTNNPPPAETTQTEDIQHTEDTSWREPEV